jgi:hypothetical protein
MNAKRSGPGSLQGDDSVPGKVFHPKLFQMDQNFFELP